MIFGKFYVGNFTVLGYLYILLVYVAHVWNILNNMSFKADQGSIKFLRLVYYCNDIEKSLV